MKRTWLGLGLLLATMGCSGTDLELGGGEDAGDDAGGDGGGLDAGDAIPGTDTGPGGDTGPGTDTGAVGDGGGSDGSIDATSDAPIPTCTTGLPTDWSDAYVDASTTKPSKGTLDCPFKTIAEATALAAPGGTKRIIHVKGGTSAAPFLYDEKSVLDVKAGVDLVGDGATTTKVTGGAVCPKKPAGATNCLFYVHTGAIVEGIAAKGTGANAIGILADGGAPAPLLRSLDAIGSSYAGIVTYGTVTIHGGVRANDNGRYGLEGWGSGTVTITGGDAFDTFLANPFAGIRMTEQAKLVATTINASNNGDAGVQLETDAPIGGALIVHEITNSIASNNAPTLGRAAGISVGRLSSLKVRGTQMLGNGGHGLWFNRSTNTLDIGAGSGSGTNVFSGATVAKRNGRSGLCIDNAGATGSQASAGNSWGGCSPLPTQSKVAMCPETTSYSEIKYSGASAGPDPVAITSCVVGP